MAADAAFSAPRSRSLASPLLSVPGKVVLAILCCMTTLPVAADVEEARRMLRKMAEANREQDYRGVFTYEHAGLLRSVRILHLFRDGLEYEKLVYLNGPPREIVRRGVPARCERDGARLPEGVPVPASLGSELEDHYELSLRGEERIAGRRAHVVHLVPRDQLRYGYILAVDRRTGLLLQSLLVNIERRVMERFQFVDVSFDLSDAEEADLLGGDARDATAAMTDGEARMLEDCGVDPAVTGEWQVGWMPPGFELAEASRDEAGVASLVYTDGLSSLSVFIDPNGEPVVPEVRARRGATVAQVARLNHGGQDYAICVVGEVPEATARKIARFIRPASP